MSGASGGGRVAPGGESEKDWKKFLVLGAKEPKKENSDGVTLGYRLLICVDLARSGDYFVAAIWRVRRLARCIEEGHFQGRNEDEI